jgi:type IV pilus assembly protein PilN
VILINLLPHREAARKRRQEVFNISLGAAALIGGLIAGLIFLTLQNQITSQQARNSTLSSEIKKLEEQIKNIATLESEILALKARQKAVENLQSDRNLPVHLLTELVRQLPDGVFITSMRQDAQMITLQGVAQSNERVSELLRNLANNTPWFTRPELVEIVASSLTLNAREQRRVANFNVRVSLVRSSEVEKTLQAGGTTAMPIANPAAQAANKVP